MSQCSLLSELVLHGVHEFILSAPPLTSMQLAAFAREGWRDVTPRTGCSSPVSRCGVWVGKAASIPARAKRTFFHLRDKKRYSDVSLVAGLLAVPVTLGE